METTKIVITPALKKVLHTYLSRHKRPDLLTTYLFYLENKFDIRPVVFMKEKRIYRGKEELIKQLEKEGRIWRETEIKIQHGTKGVNDKTKKIYICPFSGKVFGDNTHANPLDAIYDWVSKCPENTERIGGLPVKKFYVSEDPDVIKNYIKETKEPIRKKVYSSAVTGKLFNSKENVLEDFKKNQLKPISLVDVPTQNRFQIEDSFMEFIQSQIDESNITRFVEAVGEFDDLMKFTEHWFEEE
ncbi:MAG: DUF2709 domain-containing protein [Simkaniaceae bacterium]|nr:DUF2709 domain-containing protein [Simkaniaceae bacterium]